MKCHVFTGEGLLVGWVDVQSTQPQSSIEAPFHPNDFYLLIQPIISLFRWPADVTIGEFQGEANKQDWKDWCQAQDEMDDLNLYFQAAETGKRLEIWCFCIKEVDGAYTFHGSFE